MPRKEFIYRKGTIVVRRFNQKLIKEHLREGERVCIPGFGCFEARKIRAKRFFNNQIGKISRAPEHFKVKFTASSVLKKFIQ